jgi:hypothetical protein
MEQKLYEKNRFDIGGDPAIAPQNLAAGTTTSGWFGMYAYDKIMAICLGGAANDANATIDISINQAMDNAGTGSKAVTGKAITQVTAGAGFATRTDLWLIHLEVAQLDVNAGFGFIQISVTVSAGDTWYFGAVLQREEREYMPVPYAATEIVG